jgi:tetratricopeptide (TPR) repeat protein
MFLGHLVLGVAIVVPVIVFGIAHIRNTRNRPNRRAIRAGYALFGCAIALFVSGFVLTHVDAFGLRLSVDHPAVRGAAYWVHVLTPLAVVWLFVLHRLAGRRIRWRVGLGWAGVATAAAAIGVVAHGIDPRDLPWAGDRGTPADGEQYYHPSLARTATGDFIPAAVLDNNAYCLECHADVHDSWTHSVHKWSSFNNPAYAFSVRNTRQVVHARDGSADASRFCAGCHDPVPFFSGAFDDERWHDPDYDVAADPLGAAGITCTVCHSITEVTSVRGNADYVITEPVHYPFADSDVSLLQWVNRQLVKAKPDFHKETFLKPLHATTEFCSPCHKVHLPEELNDYKWLRGQNHHDSFWLSGVSGHSVSSFYYPPQAEANCNGCHMKREPVSGEGENFAADLGEDGRWTYLDHQFPSANTAIPWLVRNLLDDPDGAIEAHRQFTENALRLDLFGLRRGGSIDGELVAPLGPGTGELEPGETYLLDVVLRTLTLGHLFTEGTADSNQIWVDLELLEGDRVIGRSGGMDERRRVDPWSHFVNSFVIDREGNRINRRNAEDIFIALYNHQIPPGAADTLHYRLQVPADADGPLTVRARLRYRKFDTEYYAIFSGQPDIVNDLPIIDIAEAELVLPVRGGAPAIPAAPSGVPEWQRWNDYGIGLLRRGELRQAREAFARVEALGRPEGPINLARVYLQEGLVQTDAPAALARAGAMESEALEWHLLWFGGQVAMRNGDYRQAADNFREILRGGFRQAEGRSFDFSNDYRLRNALGQVLYQLALAETGDRRLALMGDARAEHEAALAMDPENLEAHYGMRLIARDLGDDVLEAYHAERHATYKPDDNARDVAINLARRRYPAADLAAEAVVIHDLHRPGAYGLPAAASVAGVVSASSGDPAVAPAAGDRDASAPAGMEPAP